MTAVAGVVPVSESAVADSGIEMVPSCENYNEWVDDGRWMTFVPAGCDDDRLMTQWISAPVDALVELDDAR